MTKQLKFTILGIPVAQGRPLASRRGKFIAMRDPQKSKDYKARIAYEAGQAFKALGIDRPADGPVEMGIIFHFNRPKSLPQKVEYKISKPDLDNLAKAIMDGLEGIAYLRDAQIFHLECGKQFSEQPMVEVAMILNWINGRG